MTTEGIIENTKLNDRELIRAFLSDKNNRTYNLKLAKKVSIKASILFSNLIYLDELITDNRIDDYFYTTYDKIYENTGLTARESKLAIQKLVDIKLIDNTKKGIPAKNYFKILYDLKYLDNLLNTPKLSLKNNPLVVSKEQQKVLSSNTQLNQPFTPSSQLFKNSPGQTKGPLSNKHNYNTLTSNTLFSKTSKQVNKVDIEFNTLVDLVIEYLNKKANTKYEPDTKEYIKHIHARYKEGATLVDFKKVIDIKTEEWKGDKKMARYLRPQTIFGNKFKTYLAQLQVKNIVDGIDMEKNKKIKDNSSNMELSDEEF